MRTALRTQAFWTALLAAVLALAFLGNRGIWDPDEGRYTNVAMNMLNSGDWINPHRSHEVGHWTKPPLTYWAIAGSLAVFGKNPWAARLPAALSYLLCVWLAWRIAPRLVPGTETQTSLIYATMLFTLGASQLITTDYLVAACQTLAMWGFIEARFGQSKRATRWVALMWLGFALAFLTKGPPALLPLLAVLAFDLLMPGKRMPRAFNPVGIALFGVVALPWYVVVIRGNPGLFQYFIGDEVIARVASDEFDRHGEWYGWITVYAPTLLLGTLPWTPALLRWARALPAAVRSWRDASARSAQAPALLLALWVLLPLLVFCIARSRLPLYILPLFLPLAVLAARQRQLEGRALPHWRWLASWAAILLALKTATVFWPTHKNAAEWADEIRARAQGPVGEVVIIEDMARYGIHLHLDAEVEKISMTPLPKPQRFNPEYDQDLASELAEREPHVIWVCKQERWPELQTRIAALGYHVVALGTPYENRVIFRVEPLQLQ